MEVVFTDRAAWVTGVVRFASGLTVAGDMVVAFPVDRSLWRPSSRHIRSARADVRGHYRLGPLPPGEDLLVAVADFEEVEICERETLGQISRAAVTVTLVAGETRGQNLRADATRFPDGESRSP